MGLLDPVLQVSRTLKVKVKIAASIVKAVDERQSARALSPSKTIRR